jgi:hypothetical protein
MKTPDQPEDAPVVADQINTDGDGWQREHAERMRKKDEDRQVRLQAMLTRLRSRNQK